MVVEFHGETADLADPLADPGEQFGAVLDHPVRPMFAARLLVREEQQNHVSTWLDLIHLPLLDNRQDHGVHVLHVHRTSTPDHVVVDGSLESRHRPVRGDCRHYVGMSMDHQGWRCGVLTRDAARYDLALG